MKDFAGSARVWQVSASLGLTVYLPLPSRGSERDPGIVANGCPNGATGRDINSEFRDPIRAATKPSDSARRGGASQRKDSPMRWSQTPKGRARLSAVTSPRKRRLKGSGSPNYGSRRTGLFRGRARRTRPRAPAVTIRRVMCYQKRHARRAATRCSSRSLGMGPPNA